MALLRVVLGTGGLGRGAGCDPDWLRVAPAIYTNLTQTKYELSNVCLMFCSENLEFKKGIGSIQLIFAGFLHLTAQPVCGRSQHLIQNNPYTNH